MERYVTLEQFYGNANFVLGRDDKLELLRQADVVSCSQKRTTPLGGLLGEATFAGDLSALLPILLRSRLRLSGSSCK